MFERPTRNHVSFIVERMGITFFLLLVFGWNSMGSSLQAIFTKEFWLNLLDSAESFGLKGAYLSSVLFLLALLVLLLFFLFSWHKTVFYIKDDCLVYEKRTLYKRMSKLPLQNIATVNVERNLFERFVGTSKVKVDLNSTQTANKTDFVFILHQALAQEFHETLLLRRAALLQGEEAALPGVASPRMPVISYTFLQVFAHRLLSLPWVQMVTVGLTVGIPLFTAGETSQLGETLFSLFAILLFAVVGFVFSLLNLADFRLERDETNLYISYGRLKKSSYSFRESRVNAVFIRQPALARLFGLYSVELAVVGMGNEKKETPQLCLLTTKEQMQRVMESCVPAFTHCTGEERLQHRVAWLSLTLRTLLLGALAAPLCLIPLAHAWLLPLAVFALCIIGAVLSYRTKTLRYDSTLLQYTSGIFSKRTGVFRYGNIQSTLLRSNRLYQKFAAGRLLFFLLSGPKTKLQRTGLFPLGDLEEIGERAAKCSDSSGEFIA